MAETLSQRIARLLDAGSALSIRRTAGGEYVARVEDPTDESEGQGESPHDAVTTLLAKRLGTEALR